MGDLTRAQLRTEVIANLGTRTDLGSGGGLDTINRALDRVQDRLARRNTNGWSELKRYDTDSVTIAGKTAAQLAVYSNLPANLERIHALLVKHSTLNYTYRIVELLRSQWDFLIGDSSLRAASNIANYVDERVTSSTRQLRFWPIPSSDYTLYRMYLAKPTNFTSDTMKSDFEEKDDILISGATHYMFNRYQMFEEATFWYKDYESLVVDALRIDKEKPDVFAMPRGLGVAPTSGGGAVNSWQDPFVQGNRGPRGGRR